MSGMLISHRASIAMPVPTLPLIMDPAPAASRQDGAIASAPSRAAEGATGGKRFRCVTPAIQSARSAA